ncbi:MAG: anti-sigma factor family protein [Pyrinomonadaceae bacterium]
MHCRDFRELVDSYLSDELLVETNHDLFAHLESCAACRRELAARRELRATLKTAFTRAVDLQPRAEFVARLRSELRAQSPGAKPASAAGRRAVWLALAACLLLAVGAFGVREAWRRQGAQSLSVAGSHTVDNSSPAAAVTLAANALAESAVSDHRNCALTHNLEEEPISLEEAGERYDPAYSDLDGAVMAQAGPTEPDFELIEAHACVFKGRLFGHVIVKHDGRLVSVLVTDLAQTPAKANAPEFSSGRAMSCSQLAGYQVACFETPRHAVFVVSDLGEAENLKLASSLVSPVSAHLKRAERRA